jgi:hypothetical protein
MAMSQMRQCMYSKNVQNNGTKILKKAAATADTQHS